MYAGIKCFCSNQISLCVVNNAWKSILDNKNKQHTIILSSINSRMVLEGGGYIILGQCLLALTCGCYICE